MGNLLNFMQLLNLARSNPRQAVTSILESGLQNGNINKQQYDALMGQLNGGANPNVIIQQMLNTGVVSQWQYEKARQDARAFK